MKNNIQVGDIFGRLTVTQDLGIKDKRRHWKCHCSCGSETVAWSSQLNAGRKVSCGCLRVEISKESIKRIAGRKLPEGEAARNKWFDNYRRDASKRGIKFNLTLEEFCKLTVSPCHYCGTEPVDYYGDKKRHNGLYRGNGIDRVDSKLGYSENNAVTCCKVCNYMKNTLSVEQFLSHVRKIVEFNKQESL